jgi:hypothetical protein
MSLRLEMLQVARLAKGELGEAWELVEGYVRSQQRECGGFAGRDGEADLYYTSFGIDALTALQVELPEDRLRGYLEGFADGEGLDFVHLCCLARCWSALGARGEPGGLWQRIEAYRTAEGGYHQSPGSGWGSAYGAFLAYGAYSDHGLELPRAAGLRDSLMGLRSGEGGGFFNERELPVASVPATAAAVSVLRNLGGGVGDEAGRWLLGCAHLEGGFVPFPGAQMPDLLSTAVALHGLDGLQVEWRGLRELCLDFLDSLWTAEGGFYGTWDEEVLDLEYSYYGLLALGHLSL